MHLTFKNQKEIESKWLKRQWEKELSFVRLLLQMFNAEKMLLFARKGAEKNANTRPPNIPAIPQQGLLLSESS